MFQYFNQTIIKRVTIILLVVAAIAGIIIFLVDWLSYRTIEFKLSPETKSITIYSEDIYGIYEEPDDDSIPGAKKLDKTDTIRLKNGKYFVVPFGDKITTDPIEISVNNDTKDVAINPYFSEEYLMERFSGEISTINSVIRNKYHNIINGYVIENGTFYHYGDWYITELYREDTAGQETPDSYRIIVRKINNEWQIAATPSLYFTYKENPDIPRDIISIANSTIN